MHPADDDGQQPAEHRREGRALREALAAFEACVFRTTGDPSTDQRVLRALAACAALARQRGIPPERFVAALKRALAKRRDLVAEGERPVPRKPRWTLAEALVTAAIKAYYNAGESGT